MPIQSELKSFITELIDWAKKMFKLWRQYVRLKLAIRLADMKQRAFNRRYYIMLMEYHGHERLVSVSREDLKRLKRKKWLPKWFSHIDATRECFYMTDLSRNNTLSREAREQAMRKYRKYINRK